ncbi:hypothetical protein D9M69_702010 [compost metagenome]
MPESFRKPMAGRTPVALITRSASTVCPPDSLTRKPLAGSDEPRPMALAILPTTPEGSEASSIPSTLVPV